MAVLRKNILANYLGQGWTALMGLAFIPLYIEFLGMEAYGLIGFFSVLQVCFALLDMGLTPTLSREMARYNVGVYSSESIRDLLRSVEVFLFMTTLIIVSIGVALSPWVALNWFKLIDMSNTVVTQALSIMVLVAGMRLLEGIYRGSLIGLQRQVALNVANSFLATLRWLGAVCVLAWVSPTIQAFFLWQCLSSVIAIITLALLTYNCIPENTTNAKFSWLILRGLRKFAGGMFSISVLALILTQVDKVILSRLLLLNEYGYYILAATVAGGGCTIL